jgi:SPX domain protein involved in polyphosphate accumulation
VESIGEDFLRLEKYVNLNYTGFHKILKKHDR